MGHDMKKLREADLNAVAKRVVKTEAPCGMELGQVMDCMKRYGTEADTACAKERAALASCAGRHARAPRDTTTEKRVLVRQLQSLVNSWKRFGY